jgi:succinate dehydrogenase / fumarate reductase membrane anchor subunit
MSESTPTAKPVEAKKAALKQDYRTPIARARGLGSAKSGVGHFWWQRVTAIVLAVLVPWLVGILVSFVGADLATVHATLAKPYNAILFAIFVLALFWHAKLGIQVVIEDYVHTRAYEITLQLLVTFLCVFGALASLYAIGRIALLA